MQFSTVCSWDLCCSYFIGLIQFFQQNLLSVLLLDSLLGPQLAKTRSVILEESRLFQPLSIRLEGSLRSFEMEMSEAHIFKIFICLSWWANGTTKLSNMSFCLPKNTLKPKQKCNSKPWLWKIKCLTSLVTWILQRSLSPPKSPLQPHNLKPKAEPELRVMIHDIW